MQENAQQTETMPQKLFKTKVIKLKGLCGGRKHLIPLPTPAKKSLTKRTTKPIHEFQRIRIQNLIQNFQEKQSIFAYYLSQGEKNKQNGSKESTKTPKQVLKKKSSLVLIGGIMDEDGMGRALWSIITNVQIFKRLSKRPRSTFNIISISWIFSIYFMLLTFFLSYSISRIYRQQPDHSIKVPV